MATLQQVYDLYATPGTLQQRYTIALAKVALDTLAEDANVVANTGRRKQWSHDVLTNITVWRDKMWLPFLGDAAIIANGAAATDGQIINAVQGLLNQFALS